MSQKKKQIRKILNYIKSLFAKLFQIFSNIYFRIKYSAKSDKKNFELYQVFMNNCLCQNVSIVPCCILLMGVHMLIVLLNMYMYILGYHNFKKNWNLFKIAFTSLSC